MAVYVGDLLTASAAPVSGKPTPTRTWQWLRGSTAISGATSSTYTIAEADIGETLSVKQIETNIAGTASATSLTVGPVFVSPAQLFASGEEGAWYEPSTTTCFTDTGGTVAATYGDGVAYLQDLSGNGNHATQVTAGARPILARVPEGGRRNLLEKTEQFDDAYWNLLSGGTGSTPVLTSGQTDPDGGSAAWRLQAQANNTGSSNFSILQLANQFGNQASLVGSIWVKSNTGASQDFYFRVLSTDSATTKTATTSWQRIELNNALANHFTIGARGSANGVDAVDILIWHPQLEAGSTATAYQKVVDEYDVTEAGVTSMEYLSFDGSDDFLQTAGQVITGADFGVWTGVESEGLAQGSRYMVQGLTSAAGRIMLYSTRTASDAKMITVLGAATYIDTPTQDTNPHVYTTLRTTGGFLETRFDGSVAGSRTGVPELAENAPVQIGGISGAEYYNGKIFGLIVRGAASTAQEISNTEAYLANRSGVTLP